MTEDRRSPKSGVFRFAPWFFRGVRDAKRDVAAKKKAAKKGKEKK